MISFYEKWNNFQGYQEGEGKADRRKKGNIFFIKNEKIEYKPQILLKYSPDAPVTKRGATEQGVLRLMT